MADKWLDDKGLKGIPGVSDVSAKGLGKLKFESEVQKVQSLTGLGILNLEDDELADLVRKLGNNSEARRLAKRVMRLKRQYPRGTVPELVAVDWMTRHGHWFVYQAPLLGGRQGKGGAVADIVTQSGGKGIVIRIQGDYWHSLRPQRERDQASKITLIGATYASLKVSYVVDAWEGRLYRNPGHVMSNALMGIEVGR